MKNTKAYTLFQTSNNFYLYDPKLRKILLCHPIFYYLLRMEPAGKTTDQLISSVKKDYQLPDFMRKISKKQLLYYYKKYESLRDVGYFQGLNIPEILNENIKLEEIQVMLANLRQVTLETTERCGMDCHYCGYGSFYNDYGKRKNKDLDINAAKNLINYLVNLWNSSLNISRDRNITISFYGGEPLLNFSFINEMVLFIKNLHAPNNVFNFTMTTNGALLDKYMNYLVENDFGLLISLDGDEESNVYRVFKNGDPTFRIVFNNIKKLQEEYPDYFEKKVNFNSVFHNKSTVSKVYHFFKENFEKMPSLADVSPNGIAPSKKEEFLRTYSDINKDLYQSENSDNIGEIEKDMFIKLPSIKSVSFFLQRHTGFVYDNYNELRYPEITKKMLPTGTCFPFYKKVFLTVNGKILPCERISHQYSLGYVNSKKVNIDFDAIANRYNTYFNKIRKQCNHCYGFETCQKCIFNLNLDQENLRCDSFTDYEAFRKYLATHMEYIENHPEIYSKIMREVSIE